MINKLKWILVFKEPIERLGEALRATNIEKRD